MIQERVVGDSILRKRVHRAPISLLVALIVVVGGAIAGYNFGVRMTLNSAARALRRYAVDRAAKTDRFPAEGLSVLAKMNASPFPRCSHAELAGFRKLLLESQFLKDAGRMSGGQLECSANVSETELPRTAYTPTFTGPDHALLYIHMNALHVGPLIPIVMRAGDSYVTFDPYPREDNPSKTRAVLTVKNVPEGQPSYLGGDRFHISDYLLTHNVDGRARSSLFATQCSERTPVCLTVYIAERDVLLEQRRQVRVWVAIGTLAGLCCGLAGMLLYKRNKGIERQLRRAIQRKALRVVYQPLFDMTTRAVVGAEALVRWTDEDGLAISPSVFIAIAEERGFVNRITALVVRQVLADFGGHLAEYPDFQMNVNVVASDLTDPEFIPMLDEALMRAGVSAESLVIEITEGATARHQAAMDAIGRLRGRGHRVYIDDFGTGYSSLAYLKDLSVDGIKIDKAFTRSVGTESVTVNILPQILAMAEALHLGVVAEGIETEAQYGYYRDTGMPLVAQGWLFGYAVPPQEFQYSWLSKVEEAAHAALV